MALKTWQFKIGKSEFSVKALKSDAERVKDALLDIERIHQWKNELWTNMDGKDTSSLTMVLFGANDAPIANPDAYTADKDALYASLPDPITDISGTIEAAQTVFFAHVPTVDNRKTPEELAAAAVAQKAQCEKQDAARQAQHDKFASIYAEGGANAKPIETPAETATGNGITIRHNEQFGGIEIVFDEKPSREVIDRIKSHGFRWHRLKKLWYAKQSPNREAFAQALAA